MKLLKNRKGYLNLTTWTLISAIIIFAALFAIYTAGTMYFFIYDGHITIERPYLTELNACSAGLETLNTELETCIASKIPSCAPCECKPGATGLILAIAGALFYVGSLVSNHFKSKKLDKREKELEKREKALVGKKKK